MSKHKKYFSKKAIKRRPVPIRKRKKPFANYEMLWESEYAFDRSGSGGSLTWRTLFEYLAFMAFLIGVGIFCYVFLGHGH